MRPRSSASSTISFIPKELIPSSRRSSWKRSLPSGSSDAKARSESDTQASVRASAGRAPRRCGSGPGLRAPPGGAGGAIVEHGFAVRDEYPLDRQLEQPAEEVGQAGAVDMDV